MLLELSVRDFTGFRGFHDFRFRGGFNLVRGLCGSGRTNLVRALEFALYGRTSDRPVHALINYLHRKDCESEGDIPGCEVQAVFRRGGRLLRVMRRLLESHKGLKQVLVTDSDSNNMVAPEDFMRMVIRERDIEPLGGLSLGESTPIIVLNSLARNIGDGIGMVFLDGVFGRLANEAKVELLARLNDLGLEQIFLLESIGFDESMMEGFDTNVVELPNPIPAIFWARSSS